MSKAIILNKTGNANQLKLGDWTPRDLSDDEVEIKQNCAGINYVDIYYRSGIYKPPYLPIILGREATGEVVNVGKNVSSPKIGERVCYVSHFGGYSERNIVPANITIPIPNALSDEVVAGVMLKGMTVQYLLTQTYKVTNNTKILIHAAAGGVGLIACQWAKHLGATVIGTVGSDEKAAIAKQNGCDYPIVYTKEDFVPIVMDITKGKKLPIVYDSVGKETLINSMDCLQPRGLLVSYGNASGSPPKIDVLTLMQKGSIFLTRPNLAHYILDRESILKMSEDLFSVVINNEVKISIDQLYDIEKVSKAHEDIENRITTGSTVLKF